MKLDIEETREGLRMRLSGELDHHAARETAEIIDEAIVTRLPRKVVFDLSRLTFMDSSGIAVILRTVRRLEEADGSLTLENVPPQAKKVLLASKMDRLVGNF